MRENNLFKWATSELSQDGFICWLMSFAKNHGINPQLEACAWDFIHRIPGLENAKRLISIERQVAVRIPGERKKGIIDVLLTVDNCKVKVVIEDKINLPADDAQMDKYIAALKAAGEKNVIGVFYKPISQCRFSDKYFTFTRDILFSIFKPYKDKIHSDIFADYFEYLEHFESEETAYKTLPISQWWGIRYHGFFQHLKDSGLVRDVTWYGYVANVQGGFMCMNWGWKTPQHVQKFKFTDKHFEWLYLQLENNKVCVKMGLEHGNFNKEDVRYAWERVRNYFRENLGAAFEFVHFSFSRGNKNSRWMTVGYMLYDEKNYRQQIQRMQQLFDAL